MYTVRFWVSPPARMNSSSVPGIWISSLGDIDSMPRSGREFPTSCSGYQQSHSIETGRCRDVERPSIRIAPGEIGDVLGRGDRAEVLPGRAQDVDPLWPRGEE